MSEKHDQVLVNQSLVESNIQAVQPAEQIDISLETKNNRDSVLVVQLTVDSNVRADSLSAYRANLVIASFITILPDLQSYKACKVIFIRKEGTIKTRSKTYLLHLTDGLATRVMNYKDSTKTSMGFIDTAWTYVNKDLNLSLPLKTGWFFASTENDSLVYYAIGSDVNQLPLYRLDSGRKVTDVTLRNLDPGEDHSVLEICKNNIGSRAAPYDRNVYPGPMIALGLTMNVFNSVDEHLKNINELLDHKQLSTKTIQNYSFGNASLRGYELIGKADKGKPIHYLLAIQRFRRVSLILHIIYADPKELEEVKYELSGLKIE